MKDSLLFCLCICTRQRPRMLAACLKSVVRQSPPPHWDWQVVVVENNTREEVRDLTHSIRELSCRLHYLLQPEVGIPFARNAAVEEAVRRGADWIGFIDDDETVAPDWLQQMIGAIEYHKADVIGAPVEFACDERNEQWVLESPQLAEGAVLSTTATNNVAFHRRLIAPEPEGLALRFDETRRFSGGEDIEFFSRATDRGARIVWSNGPRAIEPQIHARRLTVTWYFNRLAGHGSDLVEQAIRERGYAHALRKFALKGLSMAITVPIRIVLFSPLWLLKGRPHFRKRLKKKVTQTALGTGYLRALTGLRHTPYATVDGE